MHLEVNPNRAVVVLLALWHGEGVGFGQAVPLKCRKAENRLRRGAGARREEQVQQRGQIEGRCYSSLELVRLSGSAPLRENGFHPSS